MKTILAGIHFLLIVLTAVLLFFNVVSSPFYILLLSAVLAASSAALVFTSRRREKHLARRITKLSDELNVASGRIGAVSQEISVTIEENNDASRVLFEHIREMKCLTADVNDNLSETIVSIKDMIANTEDTLVTAEAMEKAGRDSFDTIQSSISEIMGIVDVMDKIKSASGKAAESIERLRTASADIRTIIEKISDISKQMHLITINASVEAVRAGKGGGSFSVVAKEFQNLSVMTDSAVHSISELVDAIQANVMAAYTAVKENDGCVREGVRNTKAVEHNLSLIHQSFTDVIAMVDRISGISAAEARLAQDMGNGVDRIEKLIMETDDNVALVYESALSQRKSNENISDMGARLKTAAAELNALTGGGAGGNRQTLDAAAKAECEAFLPIIRDALCKEPDIAAGRDPDRHAALLGRFKSRYPLIEAIWTNDRSGRFICSIPKAGIANAAMRDWFLSAIRGESTVSSIYISGITKSRCVTLSLPFYDEHKEISGVVGVDINLDMLLDKARKRRT